MREIKKKRDSHYYIKNNLPPKNGAAI
ncbi:hypothetical protein [Coxiella burnetii]|nr:hypothetical protein [Coxiella burnetii]